MKKIIGRLALLILWLAAIFMVGMRVYTNHECEKAGGVLVLGTSFFGVCADLKSIKVLK